MICKKCRRDFHYCMSCGYERCLAHGYCSDACMASSPEYTEAMQTINDFINGLTEEQRVLFRRVLHLYDTAYEDEVNYAVKELVMKEKGRPYV